MSGARSPNTSPPMFVWSVPTPMPSDPPIAAVYSATCCAVRLVVPSARRSPVRSASHVWSVFSSMLPMGTRAGVSK